MAALDDYRARTHLDQLSRGRFHVRYIFDCQAGENFGFRDIRGDDTGALQQFRSDKFNSGGVEKLRAAGRFHHGVMHDVRKFVRIEEFRNHNGVAAVAKHSDFHSGDLAIVG